MRILPTMMICLASGLSIVALVVPAAAQDGGSQAEATGSEAELVCMARPHGNVAQVRAQDRGRDFHILANARSAASLEAKGFTVIECQGAGLHAIGPQISFRNRMCTLAATGNEAVQNQLERALGERPAVLCANAELIAGPWRGERELGEVEN